MIKLFSPAATHGWSKIETDSEEKIETDSEDRLRTKKCDKSPINLFSDLRDTCNPTPIVVIISFNWELFMCLKIEKAT